MKIYNDILNFNNEAILYITSIVSISDDKYFFNIHINIFDTNFHLDQNLESLYSSNLSIESTKEKTFNGCLEHSIYHRITAVIATFSADAAFNNTSSFNVQEFQDHFASNIFNINVAECTALKPFRLVTYDQYLFERDLE